MHDEQKIPPEIGPHEGRELELMLAGEKPVAMFSDVIPPSFDFPEELFAPYIQNAQLVRRDVVIFTSNSNAPNIRYLFYALLGEEWRMDRLAEIHRALHQYNEPTTRELETEIGQLLGYRDRDIQVFIDRFFAPMNR